MSTDVRDDQKPHTKGSNSTVIQYVCNDLLSYSSVVVLVIRTKKRNAIKPKPMQNSSEKTQKLTFFYWLHYKCLHALIFISLNQCYFNIIEILIVFIKFVSVYSHIFQFHCNLSFSNFVVHCFVI